MELDENGRVLDDLHDERDVSGTRKQFLTFWAYRITDFHLTGCYWAFFPEKNMNAVIMSEEAKR